MAENKPLSTLKKKFEVWASENQIGVFYSDDASSVPSIIYSDNDDNELIGFQKLVLQSKPKFILIIAKDITIERGFYKANSDWFLGNDEDYEKHLSLLETNVDELVQLEIGFVQEGVYFYTLQMAEWFDDFEEIEDLIKEFPSFEEGGDQSNNKEPHLSEENRRLIAREIANSLEIQNASNAFQREEITKKMVKAQFGETSNSLLIYFKVEDIFQKEIRPQLEKQNNQEMKVKVLGLKSQGLKKVQVSSKLGVSERTVNKYWELE